MIIDVHCHYALTRFRVADAERFSFEADSGGPPGGSPETGGDTLYPGKFDACLSPRAVRRPAFRGLRRLLGVHGGERAGPDVDAQLRACFERHLGAPGPIDRYVLLAFDAYHDDAGRRPPLAVRRCDQASDLYTSNTLVRHLCRRHPERFLFGASIHPYRENAVACVREVFAAGACLLKWLPLHQNIEIGDPRTIAVLRECAALGLPVLAHYNSEFTLATNRPDQVALGPALEVLRDLRGAGSMPTFILAHVATPVTTLGNRGWYDMARNALLNEFADAPLYADISALATLGKAPFMREIVRQQELHRKLLFGSDFPVPVMLFRLWRDLGSSFDTIAQEPSWPQQAACICRTVGFNEIVFHRAATLLPNLDFFPGAVANRISA